MRIDHEDAQRGAIVIENLELEALATAGEELIRNPNETLQLQALLLRLSAGG